MSRNILFDPGFNRNSASRNFSAGHPKIQNTARRHHGWSLGHSLPGLPLASARAGGSSRRGIPSDGEGQGVGEIISNTGPGTAKRIASTGGGTGSETLVHITQPVRMAVGLSSTVVITNCKICGRIMPVSKVIQGFAGDELPKVEAKCPSCGASTWV